MGRDLTLRAGTIEQARRDAQEAFRLAESDPARALELVELSLDQLGDEDDPAIVALLSWSRGLALRGLGRSVEAADALREAIALHLAIADDTAAGRIRIALAFEELSAGNADAALALLDEADAVLSGGDAALAHMQRAVVLQRAGRAADSLEVFDGVIEEFHDLGLTTLEAKARGNRGVILTYRGEYERAALDLGIARQLFSDAGDAVWSGFATHNLGFVATRQGNLPLALRLFDEAQRDLGKAGGLRPAMLTDRVETMLDAGLASEAREVLEAAIVELEGQGLEADLAEACYLAIRASEEDGDFAAARRWAERAIELFESQRRPRWQLLARYRLERARLEQATGPGAAEVLLALAAELDEAGWWTAAAEADNLAAVLAAEQGAFEVAASAIRRARRHWRSAQAITRFDGWIAEARVHRLAGEPRQAARSVTAAFAALDDLRAVLGSTELRSSAGQRAALAEQVGVALAVAAKRPDRALHWMERARAASGINDVGQASSPEVRQALLSLREIGALLSHDPPPPREQLRLRRQELALEEIVRRGVRHAEGSRPAPVHQLSSRELSTALGERTLIEYGVLGGRVIAVTRQRNRSRLVDLAPLDDVQRAVATLRATLTNTTSRRPAPATVAAATKGADELLVAALGRQLLKGIDAAAGVVVVASGPLMSVPWSALDTLRAVPVTVAASAVEWVARHGGPPRALEKVAVVAGPGLSFADEEADAVRRIWGRAARLVPSRDATIDQVRDAIAGADVAHIAAHGLFRADNPLMSSIRCTDGALTGYDLAEISDPPAVVILSACDVGMSGSGPTGFGLPSLLIAGGAGAVVASVTSVEDESTEKLMVGLHQALRDGLEPSAAMVAARTAIDAPVDGFLSFGA